MPAHIALVGGLTPPKKSDGNKKPLSYILFLLFTLKNKKE
jgi:hypothetical protein